MEGDSYGKAKNGKKRRQPVAPEHHSHAGNVPDTCCAAVLNCISVSDDAHLYHELLQGRRCDRSGFHMAVQRFYQLCEIF